MSTPAIKLEHCISCNRLLAPNEVGQVRFSCPQCGSRIIRCGNCRNFSNKYQCVGCDFEGP